MIYISYAMLGSVMLYLEAFTTMQAAMAHRERQTSMVGNKYVQAITLRTQ